MVDEQEQAKFNEFRGRLRGLCHRYWEGTGPIFVADEIFHYCNAMGLHGIVTNKCLWASDIFSLNDASEVNYAIQMVTRVVSNYSQLRPLAERFADGTFTRIYKDLHTLVCCFSAEKDSLSQWRAYGAGGYGFANWFSPKTDF
jgi:hypothetical protein